MNNTIFFVFTITVMVLVVMFLIGTAVSDYISDKRRKEALAKRDAKQRKLNNLVRDLYVTLESPRRGFIKCEYAFGRYYIHYECINEDLEHYSVTWSYYDTGILREKYHKLNTKRGFDTQQDSDTFHNLKLKMIERINAQFIK